MKAYYIALLAFSFCLPALGAKKKTGVEKDGFKGRVKSVKGSNFNIVEKFGKPVRSSAGHKHIYKYDEKGNRTEEVGYNASGEIGGKYIYTYKYDKRGNKISRIKSKPKTAFGETRLVPTEETTYEITYWD